MIINHIGIIPDGNRRWASENSKTLFESYALFYNRIIDLIKFFLDKNIRVLSFYIISSENFKRKKEDIDAVLSAFKFSFYNDIIQLSNSKGIQFNFIGNSKYWPEWLKNLSEQLTYSCNYDMKVNLLIGYNPFDEIRLANVNSLNDLSISALSVPDKVDVIFRTAGTPARLSNFLPLQSGYAAIHTFNSYFLDVPILEYEKQYNYYSNLNMRYGK